MIQYNHNTEKKKEGKGRERMNVKYVKIIYSNSIYDVFDASTNEWLFSCTFPRNVLDGLSKMGFVKISYEEK